MPNPKERDVGSTRHLASRPKHFIVCYHNDIPPCRDKVAPRVGHSGRYDPSGVVEGLD